MGVIFMRIIGFLGLNKLVPLLLGFFSSSGPLALFFLWIGKKLSLKALILPIQFVVVGALFTAKVSFFISAFALVSYTYNTFHSLINFLNTSFVLNNGLGVAYKVLESIGFINALFDTFTSLSFVWFSVLSLIVAKFVLHSIKLISDELFKIGLLLQG